MLGRFSWLTSQQHPIINWALHGLRGSMQFSQPDRSCCVSAEYVDELDDKLRESSSLNIMQPKKNQQNVDEMEDLRKSLSLWQNKHNYLD
jgi:hypothetical protein